MGAIPATVASDMGPTEARALTDRLRASAEETWDLVVEAYVGRAWAALGYRTWDAYCAGEFGSLRLRLPPEERAGVTASLREAGLSVRAIAAATGEGKSTIARALAGVPGGTPVKGIDGKTYPMRPTRHQEEMPLWNGLVHPLLECIPLMSDDVLPGLIESISRCGLIHPGWLAADGTLLDGRLRRMACETLGVPMEWHVYRGDDEAGLIWSHNVMRQHLTGDQMAFVELAVADAKAHEPTDDLQD